MRWMILLGAFALWLFCLGLICVRFSPKEAQADVLPGSTETLDALFEIEESRLAEKWELFIDLNHLLSGAPKEAAEAWDGKNEESLRKIGVLSSTLTRADPSFAEQNTNLGLDLPIEFGLDSPALRKLGHISCRSRSHISRERGIEWFSMSLNSALFDVQSLGCREGDVLNVTTTQGTNTRPLMPPQKIPVGTRAALNLEILPFKENRNIEKGRSWRIAMWDSGALQEGNSEPRVKEVRAICTGKTEIKYGGKTIPVFAVVTGDGKARAWYSADGVVLKQSYTLFDFLEVMAVKKQKTEGKSQKTEHRSQKSEDRRQKTEDSCRQSKDQIKNIVSGFAGKIRRTGGSELLSSVFCC